MVGAAFSLRHQSIVLCCQSLADSACSTNTVVINQLSYSEIVFLNAASVDKQLDLKQNSRIHNMVHLSRKEFTMTCLVQKLRPLVSSLAPLVFCAQMGNFADSKLWIVYIFQNQTIHVLWAISSGKDPNPHLDVKLVVGRPLPIALLALPPGPSLCALWP